MAVTIKPADRRTPKQASAKRGSGKQTSAKTAADILDGLLRAMLPRQRVVRGGFGDPRPHPVHPQERLSVLQHAVTLAALRRTQG